MNRIMDGLVVICVAMLFVLIVLGAVLGLTYVLKDERQIDTSDWHKAVEEDDDPPPEYDELTK